MLGFVLVAAFERTLSALGVLGDEAPVLVALSGGLDSVVLLDVAVERLGRERVIAAHIDHAVRPESAEDAREVERIAKAQGVDFELVRLAPGPSAEERLRIERYRALEAIRGRREASAILVAHTEDDQAETVLLDLVRGGRGAELRGMPRVRGHVVRPFLSVPRAEVHARARARRLSFVEDPTNLEPGYLRNRIRKELLPLLESRYRPKLARRLAGGDGAHAARNPSPAPGVPEQDGPSVQIEIEWSSTPRPLPTDLMGCVLDARVVPRPLIILPHPGDEIELLGLGGHKKLQDLFVDAKVPRARRRQYAILVHEAHPVWVPGLARAPIGLVGPETGPVWVLTARI